MNNINTSISIGICTSNDEKTIGKLLYNLTKFSSQSISPEKRSLIYKSLFINEIIIVSSGCTDSSEIIISQFIKRFPSIISLISEKHRSGKANAINTILHKYSGEYLVLIPADAYTSIESINLLIKRIDRDDKIGIVFGKPVIDHKSHKCTVICKMNAVLWNLHTKSMTLKENNHASGELMVLRKNLVRNIPENIINDDAYLSQKIFLMKKKIVFDPTSIVLITSPLTIKDYINQRKRIYLGHNQLKTMGFSETIPFNRLSLKNKNFYLKLFLNEISSVKKLLYFGLALIVEFNLKLRIKFKINNNFTEQIIWQRIGGTLPGSGNKF